MNKSTTTTTKDHVEKFIIIKNHNFSFLEILLASFCILSSLNQIKIENFGSNSN